MTRSAYRPFFGILDWRIFIYATLLFTFLKPSEANIIVSATSPAFPAVRSELFLGGEFSNVVSVSWTQNESFSGVTIDASVGTIDPSFRDGTAYLMSMIGPGTTPASEVVTPTNFTAPIGSSAPPFMTTDVPLTVLFSGLNLAAGTYYLVVTAPSADFENLTGSPLRWNASAPPIITTAPSATLGNTNIAFDDAVKPFPPASAFQIYTVDQPLFDVLVPEPPTFEIVLISLVLLLIFARGKGGVITLR